MHVESLQDAIEMLAAVELFLQKLSRDERDALAAALRADDDCKTDSDWLMATAEKLESAERFDLFAQAVEVG